ncbi:hypothetical protein OG758_00710 [Streptomyces sp. NBC_01474]|uniref:hypothetical protein n=1 Tax=Streptomyces sp. NBC_01474 TaxID=2903880 RepID=UPI002DDC182D|nr:hypothetical protein [Streptomyces sp. NBC_01474]WSD92880.1 hypothetical protein OG758_00710 [Streptomyces sp. NBC_01474]
MIRQAKRPLHLATAWEPQRHLRWPDSSNPHLFVNGNTAVDESGPPISAVAVQLLFQRVGLPAGRCPAVRAPHATQLVTSA